MTIPRRLTTIVVTILTVVVAIAVPLISTTSAGDWRNPVLLFQSECIPLHWREVLAFRAQCQREAANQSFERRVIIPLTRGDCPRWQREWVCLGIPHDAD